MRRTPFTNRCTVQWTMIIMGGLVTLILVISLGLLYGGGTRAVIDPIEPFASDVTTRVCAVRASDGGEFEFLDPDMASLRSVPGGSAGQCYFVRAPADAKDSDCTRPHRWGVDGRHNEGVVEFRHGFVNGAERCMLNVRSGLPREKYATLQKEMRDKYAGLDSMPVMARLEAERAEGRRLQDFINPSRASVARAKLCHTAATVAPGRWTKNDRTAAAALVEDAANLPAPLPRALKADAAFLRGAADRVCRGERDACYVLRPSFDPTAPVASAEARRDARWLAAVIAGAYPARTATDAELKGIARRVCASANARSAEGKKSNRCEFLRPEWKAVADKHWSRWGATERAAATDVVKSLVGIDAGHLSDSELASLSSRVCGLKSSAVGLEGVAPGDSAPKCAALARVVGASGDEGGGWDVEAVKTKPVLRWTANDRSRAVETVRVVGGRQFSRVDDRSQIANALRKVC